jgi:hypothetical protein
MIYSRKGSEVKESTINDSSIFYAIANWNPWIRYGSKDESWYLKKTTYELCMERIAGN